MNADDVFRLLAEVVDGGEFTVKHDGPTGPCFGSWTLEYVVGGQPMSTYGTGSELEVVVEAAREQAIRSLRERVSES